MTKFNKTSGLAVSAFALFAFAAAPAQADDMMMDKGNFQVGIGGFYTQGFAFVDTDVAGETGDTEFAQNAEIHFNGSTTLDNGVQIGFRVELEATGDSGDTIDEHYTYIKGDFGKFIIGAENGVAHLGEVTAPYFVAGFASHNNSLTDDIIEGAHNNVFDANAVQDAHTSTKLENISGDAYKISYFTPRIGGLQVGASYAPNNDNIKGGDSNDGDINGNQKNIYEISLNYKADMAGLGFAAAGGYVGSESAGSGADPTSWNVGASLAYAGFTLGGNYSSYEDLGAVGDGAANSKYVRMAPARSAVFTATDAVADPNLGSQLSYGGYASSEEITTWSVGVAYDLGHTVIGFSYTDSEEDVTRSTSTQAGTQDPNNENTFAATAMTGATSGSTSTSGTEYTEWMVGGTTNIAKGVDVGYFYQATEAEYDGRSSDASLVGVTLALQF